MQDDFDIPKDFNLSQKKNVRSMKLTNNKIFIFLIFIVLTCAVVFFGYQFISPFGAKITYQFSTKDVDKVSRMNGAVSSGNIDNKAVNTLIIPQQIIRQNIVTFNLKLLSQKIDGVWVNLKFKGGPKELKIGVKGNLKEDYTYKPLYENLLEGLRDFENIDNRLIFWQKEKRYEDFDHFVENPPRDKLTGVYFFDPTEISELQSKNAPSTKVNTVVINKDLRGSHSFFVKVDNSNLNLTIEKQDRNDYKGPDVLLIEIYKGSKEISTKEIPDDGVEEISGLKLSAQKEIINIKDIERGIYRVNLIDKSSGADVSIKSVNVNQQKIVFSPPIFIVDEKPTKLWTSSNDMSLLTLHPGSLQTVKLDKKTDLEIKEKEKEYSFKLNEDKNFSSSSASSKIHLLEIPKNDLIIKGDRFFSFSQDAFFDPNIIESTDLTKVTNVNDIDYILASYQKVKRDGDWKIAQAYFDPKDIKIDGDNLYFSLESPELANYGAEIAIDSLEVTVNKPGWFSEKQTMGEKKEAADNKELTIGKQNFISKTLEKFSDFFKKLWPFDNEEKKTEVTPTPNKSIPTSMLTPEAGKLSIQVFNGGREPGTAGKFVSVLEQNGFQNVKTNTTLLSGYKNSVIKYKKDNEDTTKIKIVDKIKDLLKKDYDLVKEDLTATESSVITVILGVKPVSASPTVTPKTTVSPAATAVPTKKP